MLKALELVGFKSFADKTRFEFPPGITVVVGPNGSGKSNVVDAVKWVLGEQSVKSLRGKEMADVIFNGSGNRRALNTAEITLTLDNSTGLLAIDTPQVHITRRIYRSGEGEYLINRKPSRLRDIRDLLSGTGMGTNAYSVIEQGKVDVLLQSSPTDRRIIFEEAAGISRFKSKKLETLRRLERVEQNLLRLSDIVDEVDNRLRSVRMQAKKAHRYREHTNRLQELRTQVGLVDWRRLSEQLSVLEKATEQFSAELGQASAEAEAIEARLLEAETHLGDLNEAIRRSEAEFAANRERIASAESTIDHERARARDLDREVARCREQLAAMNARAGDLQRQASETENSLDEAEEHHRQVARLLAENERELTELIERLDRVRSEHEQHRTLYVEGMRDNAEEGSEISRLATSLEAAESTQKRASRRMADVDAQRAQLADELHALRAEQEELAQQADSQHERYIEAKAQLANHQLAHRDHQAQLAEYRQHRAGLKERADLLEELEKSLEGLSSGVKEVLAEAQHAGYGPFRHVRGLVADLLRVNLEAASMVEVALGDRAEYLIAVPDAELIEFLKNQTHTLSGRVGFVWLDGTTASEPMPSPILDGRPGVLGRADQYVQTAPEYESLARHLLGKTWMVEKLTDAFALHDSEGAGLDFVTVAGESLAADGTLSVGPASACGGLISRRSELRTFTLQIAELDAQIEQTAALVLEADKRVAESTEEADRLADAYQEATAARAEQGHKLAAAEERETHLKKQRSVFESELRAASVEREKAERALALARKQRDKIEANLAGVEKRLAELAAQRDGLEAKRQASDRGATETKVALAKSEERLRNLRARMRQFDESRQERHRAISESSEQLTQCRRRAERSEWNVLGAESEVAELYLAKEGFARQTAEVIGRRAAVQRGRTDLLASGQTVRGRVHDLEEKIHAKELAANEIRHERNSLAGRLRDDYDIELAELEHEPDDEEQLRREEVQKEIDELRRKINNLGNVNLEALEELEQLEQRHGLLAGQYGDLVDAKNTLERIIEKINIDSRRLFLETLETVKGHFATLFRNLFGGGQADIVVDEQLDILESGIEIVARPPGKEPRSISLLSGGEKTLTCVALLLAIFRSRPSPFCVLDEVDAALDEANIDRFTKVLNDFLGWTQFVIITHSKKTMTCANTIYGVTMQESGVSKQVSVRFEDVSDDGEILVRTDSADSEPDSAGDDEPQAA